MKNIIIDTDPGADDAIAIMLACKHPNINVLGLTITAGNSTLEKCSKNALNILKFCQEEGIKVYQGGEQPLKRRLEFTDDYCGKNGICEYDFEESDEIYQEKSAVDFMYECSKIVKDLIIVSIAPVSNLGRLITKYPDFKARVVTMSGYFGISEYKHTRCEWNVLVDPEAYELLVKSQLSVECIGLDVSTALNNPMIESILEESESRYTEYLRFCREFNLCKGLEPYSLLVDAMTIAYLIDESTFSMKKGEIKVGKLEQLDGTFLSLKEGEGCHQVAYRIDTEKYKQILVKELFK